MNNEGQQDNSAAGTPRGSGADSGPKHRPGSPPRRRLSGPSVPPDDRLTTILPPVRDDPQRPLRDPIEAVKAALDGQPAPATSQRRDSVALATAALEGKAPPRPRQPTGGGGGGRPPGPPPRKPPLPDWGWVQRVDWTWLDHINWMWVRRGVYAAAVVLLLLPIVTFAMAYFIVDIPRPGDIRTNQVSTILASDGWELAKIVPPEGNRERHQPRPDAGACAPGGDRGRGPKLLLQPRLLVHRLRAGGEEQHLRRRHPGRLDHHPAVRQERVGRLTTRWVGGLVRKAKELVISTKMSGEWSKDEVLQSYLNIIYFGRGAYGISAASRPTSTNPSISSRSPTAHCWPR